MGERRPQREKPETLDNDKVMLFEVSWGDLEHAKAYTQHIVGAYHFNTDWVENDPVWNLSAPDVIEKIYLPMALPKIKPSFYIPITNWRRTVFSGH